MSVKRRVARSRQPSDTDPAAEQEPDMTIPLLEQEATLGKQRRSTGTLRLSKSVRERTETLEGTLDEVSARVEVVPVNAVVTGDRPTIRQEGNVTIIPVLEERPVVSIELVLVEELHVVTTSTTVPYSRDVTLQYDDIEISEELDASRDDGSLENKITQ